jgi:hypothetical protein
MIILFTYGTKAVCGTHHGNIVVDTLDNVRRKINGYVGPQLYCMRVHGNSVALGPLTDGGDPVVLQLRRYYHGELIFSAGYSDPHHIWAYFVADEILNSK